MPSEKAVLPNVHKHAWGVVARSQEQSGCRSGSQEQDKAPHMNCEVRTSPESKIKLGTVCQRRKKKIKHIYKRTRFLLQPSRKQALTPHLGSTVDPVGGFLGSWP